MDYDALKTRVNNLIERYSELTITMSRVNTAYEHRYDPVSQTYKWYLGGVVQSAPTPVTYTGRCVEAHASDYFKARGYIKESDRIFLTNGIPKPLKNETVTIDGVDYNAYKVTPISPGGTDVLYRIYVRI